MENITLKTTALAIDTNFETVKGGLEQELAKYNGVVVTVDTLADDKKLAKQIKARGKEFDKLRKDTVAEVSAPIKTFEAQMKQLKGLCDNVAGTIESQVKTFEDEKLVEIAGIIKTALDDAREKAGVTEDFFVVDAHKALVKLTAITKTNKLTKATQSAVDELVANEKSNMQTVALRIAQLEARSYEAGLDIPIAQVNVNHFIFDDDDSYNNKLDQVIKAELQRQDEAKRRKAKLEAEEIARREAEQARQKQEQDEERNLQQERVEHHQDHQRNMHEQQVNQHVQQQQHETVTHQVTQQASENITCMAVSKFLVSVPPHVTDEQIKNKLIRTLEGAGITSLAGVEVMRNVNA